MSEEARVGVIESLKEGKPASQIKKTPNMPRQTVCDAIKRYWVIGTSLKRYIRLGMRFR